MPKIRYHVAGVEAVEDIHPDLVPFYRERAGYTVVYSEAEAAELAGAELLEVAKRVGVEAPTTLTADEKRHAIVEATAPTGEPIPPHAPPPDLTPEELAAALADPSTPDPEPTPARTTKRRTAADKEL